MLGLPTSTSTQLQLQLYFTHRLLKHQSVNNSPIQTILTWTIIIPPTYNKIKD